LKILVLRGGALGDLILTFPVLGEIRKSYPDAEVLLLGRFPQARLADPEYADRVERIDAPDLLPLFEDAPLPEIVRNRLGGFDLVISYLSDPDAIIARNLSAGGAKRVITRSSRMRSGVHAVFQLAEVLRSLGLSLHDPVPRLSVERKSAPSSKLGFHVGSGSPKKNWPIQQWTELTQRLDGFFSDFLLIGGEADDEAVREFRARCGVGRLETLLNASLMDLCQALNGCMVFLGHDSGVTHLAAAVGTPTVALFGPSDARVWAPLGDHVRVVRSPDGLMKSIRVETAAEACRRIGESARRARSRLGDS
jgi:heptosyltransferase-2